MGFGGKSQGRGLTKQGTQGSIDTGNAALGSASQVGQIASTNQGLQTGYRGASDRGANQYFGATDAGGLGPAARSQYQQDTKNIEQNNADALATGEKMLGERGFGALPGASSSLINTGNRNVGALENQAFNTAQQKQLGLGLQGINYNVGQQQLYDPLKAYQTQGGLYNAASGAFGGGIQGGNAMTQQGSILGDVGTGLEAVGMFA